MNKFDSFLCCTGMPLDWGNVSTKLKPGSHIAAIAPSLQHHTITSKIEDSGIEIRDSILFLGTPAYIVTIGRVPLEGTVAQNVLKYGVGALNVDECRIGFRNNRFLNRSKSIGYGGSDPQGIVNDGGMGRWPSNVAISDCQSILRQFPETSSGSGIKGKRTKVTCYGNPTQDLKTEWKGDSGSASRFFLNIDRSDALGGLIGYLCKLITPPGSKVMVYNLPAAATIGLRDMGFVVNEFTQNEI